MKEIKKDSSLIKEDLNHMIDNFLSYAIPRISAIRRYNTRKFIIPQNDLEHMGSVAIIGMLFSDYFNKIGIKNNTEKVMRLAITHDLDEAVTGDVPHDAKYQQGKRSETLRAALAQLSEITMENMYDMIKHEDIRKKYMDLYLEEKERKSIETKIVKLADLTDVIIYSESEMKLGNKIISVERENAKKRFDDMLAQILAHK